MFSGISGQEMDEGVLVYLHLYQRSPIEALIL